MKRSFSAPGTHSFFSKGQASNFPYVIASDASAYSPGAVTEVGPKERFMLNSCLGNHTLRNINPRQFPPAPGVRELVLCCAFISACSGNELENVPDMNPTQMMDLTVSITQVTAVVGAGK